MRHIARMIDFFNAITRKILLKVKPFKFHRCKELSEDPTNSSAWYFVTGFVIGTAAHSSDLSPLNYWFWGAIDRLIHFQKPNSIRALKKLINEAA